MNYAETGKLIGLIVAYNDNFAKGLDNQGKAQKVAAWQELLADYPAYDCITAVKDYFATETNPWIMPADIISRVKEIQKQRLEDAGGFLTLNREDELGQDDEPLPGHRERIQALYRGIRHGHITPDQYRAYKQGRLQLTDLQHQAKEITP